MKYISVPINDEAMKRLDYDQNLYGDLIEWNLTDTECKKLCDSIVIEEINIYLHKNITEYEDEKITTIKELLLCKEIIKKQNFNHEDLLEKLLYLVNCALDKKTGIFFFF